nr:GAF domain-containing protein [Comamonas sp.]
MTHLTPAPQTLDWLQALHSSDSAWLLTDDHLNVVHVNDGFTRLLGYTLQDMQGVRPLQKLLASSTDLAPHIREQLVHRGAYSGELLLTHRDGSPLWVAASINTLDRQSTPADRTAAQVIVLTDIGFTKRFEAFQRQVLEDVVQEKPLPTLMLHLCQALEALLPQVHVSILTVDEDDLLHPLAAPSLPDSLSALIEGMRIGPSTGACGAAAFLGHEVISTDLSTDPNWQDIAAPFLEAGLRACWSCPIKSHDHKVLGTFALYFESTGAPNALHQQVVKACLYLSAIAME